MSDNPIDDIAAGTVTLDSLHSLPRWVAWRTERRIGENGKAGELTRIPYDPVTKRRASATNHETWANFDRAKQHAEAIVNGSGGGEGIVLGKLGYHDRWIGGIDLDSCINVNGTTEPWAAEVIRRFNTYTEISPSGTGLKLFFLADDDSVTQMAPFLTKQGAKIFKRGNGATIRLASNFMCPIATSPSPASKYQICRPN